MNTSTAQNRAATKQVSVQCPNGTLVAGGGANVLADVPVQVAIQSSAPTANGWHASAVQFGGFANNGAQGQNSDTSAEPWQLTVYAVCLVTQ